jgi:hypothetical protein
MRYRTRVFGMLLLACGAASCLDDSITGTRPLTFSLTSDLTSAIVDQAITFNYAATGTSMVGVVVTYGDGVADSVFTPGNVIQASGEFTHVWDAVGSYVVSGRVETLLGVETEEITITIN